MSVMNWREYIVSDPEVCHGQVCVKDTRIPVSVVLDNLAVGVSREELLRDFPSLSEEAVRAAIAYAAELARERVIFLSA